MDIAARFADTTREERAAATFWLMLFCGVSGDDCRTLWKTGDFPPGTDAKANRYVKQLEQRRERMAAKQEQTR